ncbi:hypothetical protein BST23_04205 [Mycolicibacterium elephantis]|uniref:Phage portal protein n=1 Tax=Mycolicibacterium elephantis TaxID=81858 RepID=A0A1X0D971_9MYCO|nr:hypothetical protein BST23_04205 [Mycolicibacterium elephantis]
MVSLAERLRIAGVDAHPDAWTLFQRSDLDQLSATAHQRALLYGNCPVLVWTDPSGQPRATIESPRQMAVQRDPVTSQIVAGIKRVRTKTTTEAWVYLPDEIQHFRADTPGAATAGFYMVERVPNPLGVVPIAVLGHPDDVSVIDDLITLQDMLNKLLLDAMVASEYAGRPRRWASGIELVETPVLDDDGNPVINDGEAVSETVNPFPEANRMMIAENDNAKFGQLAAADLAGFEAGVRVVISQAMMVSGLPAHYVGLLQDSVTSADALRAAEAALVARAEARQQTYGPAWETVAQLLIGIATGVDPHEVDVRIKWAPADTRSQAQEADATVKLFAAGLLSRTSALRKLGWTDDEIAAELVHPSRRSPTVHPTHKPRPQRATEPGITHERYHRPCRRGNPRHRRGKPGLRRGHRGGKPGREDRQHRHVLTVLCREAAQRSGQTAHPRPAGRRTGPPAAHRTGARHRQAGGPGRFGVRS